MKNYSLEDESVKHPYEYYGNVFEEKHGEGTFLFKSALQYVVDDYDPYLGSVEQSHYDDLGYYEVTNFDFEKSPTELDLTWMKKEDTFVLDKSAQYMTLESIKTNIDNIGYSHLPYSKEGKSVIVIVVKGKTESSVIKQVRDLIRFIKRNKEFITGMKFEGFNPLMEVILESYAKRYEIQVIKEEQQKRTR